MNHVRVSLSHVNSQGLEHRVNAGTFFAPHLLTIGRKSAVHCSHDWSIDKWHELYKWLNSIKVLSVCEIAFSTDLAWLYVSHTCHVIEATTSIKGRHPVLTLPPVCLSAERRSCTCHVFRDLSLDSLTNMKKSQDAKSGSTVGGWWQPFCISPRNCWVRTEAWDTALSWWSSQVCSRQSSGRRLRTFSRSRRKT
jgi:hypothetical protein